MRSAKTGMGKLALELRTSRLLQLGAIIGVLLTSVPAILVLYARRG